MYTGAIAVELTIAPAFCLLPIRHFFFFGFGSGNASHVTTNKLFLPGSLALVAAITSIAVKEIMY